MKNRSPYPVSITHVLLFIIFLWAVLPVNAVELPTYTVATLPAPGTAGRLAYVTDESDSPYNARGVYLDQGSQWFKLENNIINARIFPGVTGKCADNQTTGLTNWINTVKKVQAQNLNFAGQLPAGCYRYTTQLPDLSTNGLTITGEGRRSVLFNASAGVALRITGQNVTLRDITIEGIPGSSHGINLIESHYFSGYNVVVSSAGNGLNGWQVEGVITLTCVDCRGTCNVPGCQLYTTDITNNGGRGTVGRALNIANGPTWSNNNHSWISFMNNGGHTGHGVLVADSTGVNFFGGVFEAAPAGFNVMILGRTKNSSVYGAYFSVGSGLGLDLVDAVGTVVSGGQSNGGVKVFGDTRSAVFVNHEFSTLDVLVDSGTGNTPRMNTFIGCRITGTITDNGINTTYVANTDNTNTPLRNNSFPGGITVGAGGAQIIKHISTAASLNFGSIAANSCSSLTTTVNGAADGDVVTLGIPNALASTAGVTFTGFVSAANTVTVKACNVATSASANPAAAVVRVGITKY